MSSVLSVNFWLDAGEWFCARAAALCVLLQNAEYYEYMKTYSPVDNIQRADYPNILVTAGLHDPRVGYW